MLSIWDAAEKKKNHNISPPSLEPRSAFLHLWVFRGIQRVRFLPGVGLDQTGGSLAPSEENSGADSPSRARFFLDPRHNATAPQSPHAPSREAISAARHERGPPITGKYPRYAPPYRALFRRPREPFPPSSVIVVGRTPRRSSSVTIFITFRLTHHNANNTTATRLKDKKRPNKKAAKEKTPRRREDPRRTSPQTGASKGNKCPGKSKPPSGGQHKREVRKKITRYLGIRRTSVEKKGEDRPLPPVRALFFLLEDITGRAGLFFPSN